MRAVFKSDSVLKLAFILALVLAYCTGGEKASHTANQAVERAPSSSVAPAGGVPEAEVVRSDQIAQRVR